MRVCIKGQADLAVPEDLRDNFCMDVQYFKKEAFSSGKAGHLEDILAALNIQCVDPLFLLR